MAVRKILLVDDEIPFAKFLIESFGEYEPAFDVFHVNNGRAALALLNSGYRPDLILSDLRMPRMSGHELASKVRADPSLSSVPFYILSSSACEDDDKGQACLADLHIEKPYNYGQVLALVEQLRAALAPERYAVGPGVGLPAH